MVAQCFRTAFADWRWRLLQPPGLWFQPQRRWLGRDNRYFRAAQSPAIAERKILSRPGHRRTLWRVRAKRALQWTSGFAHDRGRGAEYHWRLGATEISPRE